MQTIIKVKGMHCTGCENRIINSLTAIDNITQVLANHETGEITITSTTSLDLSFIKDKLTDLGFEVISIK